MVGIPGEKGKIMRILLVMDQLDDKNNGTTISAQRLAVTLREHGNEVRTVSVGEASHDRYSLKELKLLPGVRGIVHNQGMLFAYPDRVVLEKAIRWADVVHFLMPFWVSSKGRRLAERLGVPHTAAFHVQPENVSYNIGLGKYEAVNNTIYTYFRQFYNQFTHVHCPSRFIARELKRHGYTAQLHVISNGVDRDFVYRKSPKPKQLEGKFVILMVGRLSNEKRQDVLIEAVRQSKYESRIQLLLAGRGPKQKKYESLAQGLTNRPIIGFYSKQELLDLLSICDLYAHAADVEIEAISCIEAFSSGLVPVIANSPKSATPQFALDERSLFRAGDSGDLAAKIDYWIEHQEERRRMERVYSEHGKQYNIDACVAQMEEMFAAAIEENQCAK